MAKKARTRRLAGEANHRTLRACELALLRAMKNSPHGTLTGLAYAVRVLDAAKGSILRAGR